jgi:hypothetical protein
MAAVLSHGLCFRSAASEGGRLQRRVSPRTYFGAPLNSTKQKLAAIKMPPKPRQIADNAFDIMQNLILLRRIVRLFLERVTSAAVLE